MNTSYINKAEFEEFFHIELDEEEFKELLYLAEEKVNRLTYNRIVGYGFENLTSFQKEKIKMATGYQIKYLKENGIEDDSDDVDSYSVLDISVSVGSENKSPAKKLHMSNISYDLLIKTGLCTNNFRWH